jgi:hypothetical protein
MQRSHVNQVNLIALFGKPAGMTTWPTTDIQNLGWHRREKTLEKLTRTFTINLTRTRVQSGRLISGGIVVSDFLGLWRM